MDRDSERSPLAPTWLQKAQREPRELGAAGGWPRHTESQHPLWTDRLLEDAGTLVHLGP